MYECKNPKYAAADSSLIDVDYNHPEYGWIPFTASPNDTAQHGREIYAAAIAGEYGSIAPYVGRPEKEILEQQMRSHRDQLLHELDVIVSNPLRWGEFSEAERQALAEYRQALLDVPQQAGFPENVVFPDKPDFIK